MPFSTLCTYIQLFDRESCTYTYLLADTDSKEAILIDPVIELAQRDRQVLEDLGLNLVYASKFFASRCSINNVCYMYRTCTSRSS